MKKWFAQCLPLLAVPLMAACGGGGSGGSTLAPNTATTTPGSLVYAAPLRQASLDAATFKANVVADPNGGAQLYALAAAGAGVATLPCGVDIYKFQYYTVGGAGESTQATGALMIPTGPGCTGPRPIVLYAHGTNTSRDYDLSALQISTNAAHSESALIATMFASNGLIVVAPNYVGYDKATLGNATLNYTPYLNAAQSAHEMQDALKAARAALPNALTATGDAHALFVTGYSQGGHVAMATVRALDAAGTPPTGSAPMSGPYAMEAFGDTIFSGTVDIGATVFVPMIVASYQKAYGNVYQTSSAEVFAAPYASSIDGLLPTSLSESQLFSEGLLPLTALFDSAPSGIYAFLGTAQFQISPVVGTFGKGTPFLINDSARAGYLGDPTFPDPALLQSNIFPSASPVSPFRQDLRINDLRLNAAGQAALWTPSARMLLCAGGNDPTVFALNTQIMQTYFSLSNPANPVVLNIDPAASSQTNLTSTPGLDATPGFAALEAAFNQTNSAAAAADSQLATQNYHETVSPFCTAAAAAFFKSLLP